MTTPPALVIFDMAGTTIEDRGQVPTAFAAALAANGISVSADDITRVRGAAKRQAIREFLRETPSDAGLDEATSRTREDRIYGEFRKHLTDAYRNGGARCVPGADGVIRGLHARGCKIALTTGFDRDIATLLLATIGWTRSMIDVIVCGDDVANGRPAPDMILLAMKLTGVTDPMQVANVGDTTSDLESAARAGVRWNIGVLSGAHSREALLRAPHTDIIQSVREIDQVLRS